MIGYLKGTVEAVEEDLLILDVAGVGYNIMITGKAAEVISHRGDIMKVYTYLSVREDAMKLYGFLEKEDLDFFKLLIGVNGIGPKVAQTILSAIDASSLRYAILSADVKTLSKCPGIGAKTAQRIILDLKDKVHLEDAFENTSSIGAHSNENELPDSKKEALEALVALGYSASEALHALKNVTNAEILDVEELLKAALRNISL